MYRVSIVKTGSVELIQYGPYYMYMAEKNEGDSLLGLFFIVTT